MKFCSCGCGKQIKEKNKFINGHNARGKEGFWKNKKFTKEHKSKISKGYDENIIRFKGKHHTKESIDMMKNKLKGQSRTEKQKENISFGIKKRIKTREHLRKIFETRKINGFKHSNESKMKISAKMKGTKNTNETKLKKRCSAIKRIEANNGYMPSYNKKSIPIFQEFKKINNLKNCYFACNPNEWHIKGTTYHLDFIDFDKKLIIEIDEKYHEKQKEKDLIRENDIKEIYSDFKFLRFKDVEMNKILELKI